MRGDYEFLENLEVVSEIRLVRVITIYELLMWKMVGLIVILYWNFETCNGLFSHKDALWAFQTLVLKPGSWKK